MEKSEYSRVVRMDGIWEVECAAKNDLIREQIEQDRLVRRIE